MAFLEFKINLERTAQALERIACALESLVPKPVERKPMKAAPRGAVRIIRDRDIWQRQELKKMLEARGYSPKEVAAHLERWKSEEREGVFPPQSAGTKPLSDPLEP
jgi:hypothetical protein